MRTSLLTKIKIIFYIVKQVITQPQFKKYDPYDTDFYANPNPLRLEMLKNHNVFFCPKLASWLVSVDHEKTFSLTKNEKLSVCINDWKFSKSRKSETSKDPLENILKNLLMSLPTSDHRRIRKLVQPAFSKRQIDKMDTIICAVISDAVAEFKALNSPFCLIDLTKEIPLKIMAEIFGIPKENHKEFEGLSDAIMATYIPKKAVDIDLAYKGIASVRNIIESRRLNPGDDLITDLVEIADDKDGQLTTDEIVALIASLLTAGPETTQQFLNFLTKTLIENPNVIEQLKNDSSLIDDALAESTRVNSTAHSGIIRFAKEDIVIEGIKINKGEMVRINVQTANIDENVFPNPLDFDLTRNNLNKVWLFGAGGHFCLGSHMATLIAKRYLLIFFQNFPGPRIIEGPVFEKDIMKRNMVKLIIDPS